MRLINQDRDCMHVIYAKSRIYSRVIYRLKYRWWFFVKVTKWGYNVYLRNPHCRPQLLGTYDDRIDAEWVVDDIHRAYRCGSEHYTLPECASDDDLESLNDEMERMGGYAGV